MKYNLINYCLVFLCCLILEQSYGQVDTISPYHSISTEFYLSSIDYPAQVARILPERPGVLKGIRIHLSGGSGTCKVHVYGHQGGVILPIFEKDLITPLDLNKTQEGDTTIVFNFQDSIKFENDQFFISLDQFNGDFGVKQDTTYLKDFCSSATGGDFNPSYLLSRKFSKFAGDNFHMMIDVILDYHPERKPIFKEVTGDVGLPTDLSNHTASWADVDSDYWPDLLLGQYLYKNKGGIFEKVSLLPTSAFKKGNKKSAFIDMNNDGHWDIMIFGGKRSWLLLNDGNGVFKQLKLNIPPHISIEAFSIADINQDQYPDLVLVQIWGKYPEPTPNFLLLNNGELGFENVTSRLYPQSTDAYNFPDGIPCIAEKNRSHLPDENRNRRSRATQFVDYDQDGDEDLYIANYFLEKDEFYENDGKGYFTPIDAPKPKEQNDTISNHGTGVAWYDFDNDGDFDVLVPQLAHPRNMGKHGHRGICLYRNEESTFIDMTAESGIQYEETHAGAGFGDLNNDGLVDLVTTVYYGCRFIDLYLQQPDHTFQISTSQSGLSKLSTGSDVSFVDFNKDGKLDLAFGKEGVFHLFENIQPSSNNWLKLNLNCASYNHFGIGAIVKVYVGDEVYAQEVGSGKGQGMQVPTTLHFGLGQALLVDKVEVWFGRKRVAVSRNLKVNATYVIEDSLQ